MVMDIHSIINGTNIFELDFVTLLKRGATWGIHLHIIRGHSRLDDCCNNI
jgi:hypothetical protein